MLTPDVMDALRWVAEVVACITAAAITVIYTGSVVTLMWFLCRESGQEGENWWSAVVEDYEGPQEDSRGIPPPPPKRQH